jgi:HSP20 family protein
VADISENEHAVLITLEVPGVHSESIEVLTEDSVLTIRGEKKPVELPETRVLRSERVTGKFSRQFRLSKTSDTANVTATYADGLLTVRVAKAAPVQPRRVTVQVGATQVSAPTTAPAAIA